MEEVILWAESPVPAVGIVSEEINAGLARFACGNPRAGGHEETRIATRPKVLLASMLGVAVFASSALGQAYPTKPVRLIVPFAPGGGSEITARVVGQKLTEALGQTFVIDPRPGGASLIGTQIVAKATPDGYTLLLADSVYTITSISYAKAPYDALADFAPIGLIATTPRTLMAHASFAHSLKDVIAMPNSESAKIALGTSGGTPQMTYQLLRIKTGLTLNEVTYKGGGPALLDAVAGQIPLVFTSLAAGITYLKNGRLKGLGITTAKRHPSAPDIPTFQEAGVDDFVMVNWYGILAPAGTPAFVLQLLNRELAKALAAQDARDRLSALTFDITPGSREEFTELLNSELTHWKNVVAQTQTLRR